MIAIAAVYGGFFWMVITAITLAYETKRIDRLRENNAKDYAELKELRAVPKWAFTPLLIAPIPGLIAVWRGFVYLHENPRRSRNRSSAHGFAVLPPR